MTNSYSSLAISDPDALCFGHSPKPVHCGFGITIGGGQVYPELNFTLPTMTIEQATWADVRKHYQEIADMVIRAGSACIFPGWWWSSSYCLR